MNRSITTRNFLGGFLGGTIGILIFWYLTPIMLPFGVLIGVIIGWWIEDIVKVFIQSRHDASDFWRKLMARIISERIRLSYQNFLECIKAIVVLGIKKIGIAVSYISKCIRFPFQCMAICVQKVMSMLTYFMEWTLHPASVAFLISISAIIVGAALNALAIGMLWPWPETHMIGGPMTNMPLTEVPFKFSNIVFLTSIVTFLLTMFGAVSFIAKNEEGNSMRTFYVRWERYSQHSVISYFAKELFYFFRSEVVIVIFIITAIAYWVTLGGALIALVVIPVATFVTFMMGLYKIAQRSAHWWCLGITLIVTTISALIFYNSFTNEVILWTVALGTGIISGAVTEGLRQLGVLWETTAIGQHYINIWHDNDKVLIFSIATSVWCMLGKTFMKAGNRFVPYAL